MWQKFTIFNLAAIAVLTVFVVGINNFKPQNVLNTSDKTAQNTYNSNPLEVENFKNNLLNVYAENPLKETEVLHTKTSSYTMFRPGEKIENDYEEWVDKNGNERSVRVANFGENKIEEIVKEENGFYYWYTDYLELYNERIFKCS